MPTGRTLPVGAGPSRAGAIRVEHAGHGTAVAPDRVAGVPYHRHIPCDHQRRHRWCRRRPTGIAKLPGSQDGANGRGSLRSSCSTVAMPFPSRTDATITNTLRPGHS
jgi:hypothetical protein